MAGSSTKGGAGRYGGNVMTNSANGMQDMFRTLQQAGRVIENSTAQHVNPAMAGITANMQGTTYNPAQLTGQANGYQAALGQAGGYNAAQGTAASYGATGGGPAQQYQAMMQQNPEMIRSLMSQYTNPHETEVVQRTADQMQRATQQQQMGNAAAASAAGAFGGSRHGITEGVTNAEGQRNIGDMTAQLRQQGFETAGQLAGQDVANRIGVRTGNQNAGNQAAQFNAGQRQQMGMFNADAQNQANQFNAGNRQQMSMFNTGERNQASSFLADARNAMSQFNAGSQNQARQFGADAQNQRSMFNVGETNAARQFGAANQQQANMLNQDARNQGAQFNAQNTNRAREFNANATTNLRNDRAQNLMQLASGMGNASQQAFGIGNTINQNQAQAGQQQQALLQQIMGGSQNLFDQYAQNPQNALNMLMQAAGQSPLNSATTTRGSQTTPNTTLANLLGAAGNMFQFAPIALSSASFKHEVQPTGRKIKSRSGHVVDEVQFRYLPEIDPSQTCYTGIIAESLPVNDVAIVTCQAGRHMAVDYSQLEVVQ